MHEISVTSGRSGRKRDPLGRPKQSFWRKHKAMRVTTVLVSLILLASAIGVGAGFLVLSAFQVGLPSVADLPNLGPPQDSYLRASDGTLLAVLHEPGVHHTNVKLSQISPWLVKATIAVEDRHFYQDTASADLPRILASAVHDLSHHSSLQGASTITEQLAKIAFLTPQQTITRKIRELLLGYEIARVFTPHKILQMYLNRIPYGNQAVGAGTASELYYHLPASKLDLAQASMLAGIPDAPTLFDPLINPGYAKQRQKVVLQAMVNNGDVSEATAKAAAAEKLTYYSWTTSDPLRAPDFVQYAESQLQSQFGDAYLNPGGWNIYTSLDLQDQEIAEGDVQNPTTDAYYQSEFNIGDAALVSMDPRSGEILAMVGTTNYAGPYGQINMVTEPGRPGSSFKMFTYTAALASGKFTMTTPIDDAPININGYSPQNYEHDFIGLCPLKICLGNSINIPAVKTEMMTGLSDVVSFAERMGATSLLNPQNTYGPALTLGGLSEGVSELQMATGASVLASGGVLHKPTAIVRITRGNRTIYQYDVAKNSLQVVTPDVAYIMNAILSDNNNRLMDFGPDNHLTLTGRPVSAKTGTADLQYANGTYSNGLENNWTFGWTPQMVTGVWVGNANGAPLSRVASGITGAAPMWQTYMQDALQGQPVLWYPKPADLVQVGSGINADYYLPNTLSHANTPVNCPSAYRNNWNGVC